MKLVVTVSCGIDIIEIDRVKSGIEKNKQNFINKIFTVNEVEYCESKRNQKYQHYAARFAAKEATFKAISKFIKEKYSITWKNFEINNDKQGKPQLNFIDINIPEIESIDVSISHCKSYAIANVIVLYK